MTQRSAATRIGQFIGDALFGLAFFGLMVSICSRDGGARAEAHMGAQSAGHDAAYILAAPAGNRDSTIVGLMPQAYPQSLITIDFQPPGTMPLRETGQQTALGLLAIAFSALVALNLGFWRHLRRNYALLG